MSILKKVLKFSVGTITGLIVSMFVVAFLISSIGAWLSGGLDEWKAVMVSAAPYLLVLRCAVYVVGAILLVSAYRRYQDKGDTESMTRLKKIGGFGVLLILFIEIPKILTQFFAG